MQPLFLSSHPALDFLNTSFRPEPERVELIGDGASFMAWLVSTQLLDAANATRLKRRFGLAALDASAAEARKLRSWADDWVARWCEMPEANYEPELRRLNGLLGKARHSSELLAKAGGFQVIQRHRIEDADDLIALVAAPLAALLAEESSQLVKRCAGPGCTLWFLDRTKAHGRLFCSATACGNRAKVAAFRQRQRAG